MKGSTAQWAVVEQCCYNDAVAEVFAVCEYEETAHRVARGLNREYRNEDGWEGTRVRVVLMKEGVPVPVVPWNPLWGGKEK